MKNRILLLLMIALLIPSVAYAFNFDVDGTTVEFDGNDLTVKDKDGEIKITEDSIVATGDKGEVTITENTISASGEEGSFDAENVVIDEDGSVTMDGVDIKFDNDDDIDVVGLGEVLMLEESEEIDSTLKLIEVKEDSIVFEDNGKEVIVNIGSKGVKVSDNLGSVIAYYGESGIETSDIKIGDKSGSIYLETDFGQVRIGALPLRLVRETVNKGVKINRVEFEWSAGGDQLLYSINGIKAQRLLWIIPVSINETHVLSVEDGVLQDIKKSVWHSLLDLISF